jgi:hypothetical protein
MKIGFLLLLLTASAVALAGCKDRQSEYTMSQADVLAREESLRGYIFEKKGVPGPYKVGRGTIGNIGTAGGITAGQGSGQTKVSWPATKGYSFEAQSYLNAEGGAFIVVRKVLARGFSATDLAKEP